MTVMTQDVTRILERLRSETEAASRTEAADMIEALHQQLADAQAAQALVVERAAEVGASIAERTRPDGFPEEASNAYHSGAMDVVDAIRTLADSSGVEALAALRASCDRWKATATEGLALLKDAEAERDALAAKLAAAEARVGELMEALENYRSTLCEGFCGEDTWCDDGHHHPDIQRDCGGCLAASAILKAAALTTPAEETKG